MSHNDANRKSYNMLIHETIDEKPNQQHPKFIPSNQVKERTLPSTKRKSGQAATQDYSNNKVLLKKVNNKYHRPIA